MTKEQFTQFARRQAAKQAAYLVSGRLEALSGEVFEVARSYGHAKYRIVGASERHARDVTYTLFHYEHGGAAVLDGNIVRDPDRTFRINFVRLGGYDGPPHGASLLGLLDWPEVPEALILLV
jgi:hypothetical protein